MNRNNKNPNGEMGIMEHLTELRTCLIHSVIAIAICSGLTFFFSTEIFEILTLPFKSAFGPNLLIGTGPAEALTLKISVSLFSAILVALPYIFYQLWRFIAPGLYETEKKLVFPFVIITTICFISGVYFCYKFIFPITFAFFKQQYSSIDLQPQIRLSEQLALTVKMLLGFGIIFELPVLSFILAKLGILTSAMLTAGWRYIILGIFVVAGFFTPPDVVSQLLTTTPMIALYGISILIVKFCERSSDADTKTE